MRTGEMEWVFLSNAVVLGPEWLRGGGGPWKGKAPSYAPSAGTKASSGAGEAGPRRGCGRERREAGVAAAARPSTGQGFS